MTDERDHFWPGLYKLCTYAYWHRLWIAQEVLLARKISILHGGVEVSWDILSEILLEYSDSSWFLECEDGSGFMVDQAIRGTPAFPFFMSRHASQGLVHYGSRLHDLLREYHTSLCEDPRDRIFGLLSLTRNGTGFSVDYNKTRFALFYNAWLHFNKDGSSELAYLIMKALELDLDDLESEISKDLDGFHWNTALSLARPLRNVEMLNPHVRRPIFDQISGSSGIPWKCYLCDQIVPVRPPKRDEFVCCLVRSGFPNHIIFEPSKSYSFVYFPAMFTILKWPSGGEGLREEKVPLEECRLTMLEGRDRMIVKLDMSCPTLVFLLRQLEIMVREDLTSLLREEVFSSVNGQLYRFILSFS